MTFCTLSRSLVFFAVICFTQPLAAQTHAGQTDTDGILSQGELANPGIDYDKAQRSKERQGDSRVDNPYNDSAADRDAAIKSDSRARYDYEHDRRNDDRDDRNERTDRRSSWWPW